ncbi:hypothetical protein BEWA_053470 [Theileria equi strain WA]|uniref:Uncharacterized protein n=1 Tax=Theileria equi strain WA TaxID=1537102 RepID=L1LCZ9_THEEQ|nr:hypothetical protein BEWA_053470 [Theileria equi strain WA]EKX73292.1 hypothetical protein BEWA_053470 [Theileria equi strain WA]|eukprot:XP_004832744.1 hypothetical protein BEWA_053470 [Theileria equi strain WA]
MDLTNPDSKLFEIEGEMQSEYPISITPWREYYVTRVIYSGGTLWRSQDDWECTHVYAYSRANDTLLMMGFKRARRREYRALHRDKGGEWEDLSTEFKDKSDQEIQSMLDNVRGNVNACNSSPPSPRFSPIKPPVSSHGPGLPEPKYDQDDTKFSWDDLIKYAKEIEDEEKEEKLENFNIHTHEEYEDEEVVEDQNDTTLMKTPISVNGKLINVNGTRVADSGISTTFRHKTRKDPPRLIIDIEQGLTGTSHTREYGDDSEKVRLDKYEKPDYSGFYMFTHDSPDGRPFKVKKLNYKHQDITKYFEFDNDKEIVHIAVWYWKHNGMKNPLLIEVLDEDETYTYHYNNGSLEWQQLSEHKNNNSELIGEPLEQILDDLNCRLNDAVTMDITEKVSTSETSYCCDGHNGSEKISLEKKDILIDGKIFKEYYKHQINAGDKLAKIKYYPKNVSGDDERRVITTRGLTFPINRAVSVYVFYCNNKPVMIHVDSNQKKWYKRESKNSHDWKNLVGELDGKDPDNIKGCSDLENMKGELEKLDCRGLKGCIQYGKRMNSSVVISSTASNPKVVIQLSQKPDVDNTPTYYYGDILRNKKTKVTRSIYPLNPSAGLAQDFYKYTHENTNIGQNLKLERINDDNNENVGLTEDNVLSISAYYWKYENGSGPPNKALLVEVIRKDSPKYIYYEKNSTKYKWEPYNPAGSHNGLIPYKLLHKLTLLNCEINNVVQIDVSKIADYCHYNTDPKHEDGYTKKIKVTETGQGYLGNYTAYAHSPSGGKSFDISRFTNITDEIKLQGINPSLPIRNASKVTVFMCDKNSPHNKTPLLIHIEAPSISRKWFKGTNGGTNLEHTYKLNVNKYDDYPVIVDFLDTLDSDCRPPEVTIDIYKRGTSDGPAFHYEHTSDNHKQIYVIGTTVTNVPGFTEFIHKVQNRKGSYFTINKFKYSGNNTSVIVNGTSIKYVTSVSVFYWSALESPERRDKRGRPLLVKVITKFLGGKKATETYYENIGENTNLNWQLVPVTSQDLAQKLQLLNCRVNNAVIINVGIKEDTTYDTCNDTDKLTLDPHGERTQVKKDNTSNTSIKQYDVYTHTLNNGGGNFHIVGFINGDTPRTNLTGLYVSYDRPILDVSEVRVYFCSKDKVKRPLLIYYHISNGGSPEHKWYKNENPDDKNGSWKVVTGFIQNTYNRGPILTVPNGLSLCAQSTSAHAETTSTLNQATEGSPPTLAPTSSPPGTTTPKLTGVLELPASIAGYFFAGSAGSAATFFGGWKLYNRYKGDPWVRYGYPIEFKECTMLSMHGSTRGHLQQNE